MVVTAAALAVAGTAYSAYNSSQTASAQQKAISGAANAAGGGAAVFGQKIQPVNYTPLNQSDPGYTAASRLAVDGNLKNLSEDSALASRTNTATTAEQMARVTGLDPTFAASMNQLYQNRNNELAGNIPYADALQSMSQTNRIANDAGGAGSATPQVAADLGISRLSLMNQGASLSSQIQGILNGVAPVSSLASPQSYQINPQSYAASTISDNQFGATFQGQQNAIRAGADPAAAGAYNQSMFQAGLASQNAASQAMAISGVGRSLGGVGSAYSSYQRQQNSLSGGGGAGANPPAGYDSYGNYIGAGTGPGVSYDGQPYTTSYPAAAGV